MGAYKWLLIYRNQCTIYTKGPRIQLCVRERDGIEVVISYYLQKKAQNIQQGPRIQLLYVSECVRVRVRWLLDPRGLFKR